MAASVALRDEPGPTALLHVNYGQRTEARELASFNAIADFYGIPDRLVADIGYLREIGGSALTEPSIEVPEGPARAGEIPSTYVPFRNAHLLSIAVSWAEVRGARKVYIGAVEEDAPGYPDCRRAFFDAFEKAVELGTRPGAGIRIVTPLIDMQKPGIVRLGVELGTPFHLTWSCYRDSDLACGRCDSCLLRLGGFEGAEAKDPIPYRK